jgi:hypothetical protein
MATPGFSRPGFSRLYALLAAAAVFSAGTASAGSQKAYVVSNPIPPRMQWKANWGYCGEVSFISAGLYYGEYISQYDARALASPGIPQNQKDSQLLLGKNDEAIAAAMHLNAVRWKASNETSTSEFLAWIKDNVAQGYPVVIGVYMNYYRFYGVRKPDAGDPRLDHIVPVFGVSSYEPLPSNAYEASDTLSFNDNGEWEQGGVYTYQFTNRMGPFQKTRRKANAPAGNLFSIDDAGQNYGVVFTGVMDTDHDTLPVRVATSVNDEQPHIRYGSARRPPAKPLTLTVTVSGLTPGVAYKLYRYSRLEKTPDDHFNAHAGNATSTWNIDIASGSTYTITDPIMSDDEAVYRAVPASAP